MIMEDEALPPVSKTTRTVTILTIVISLVLLAVGIGTRLAAETERAAEREAEVAAQRERALLPREVVVTLTEPIQYEFTFPITGTLDPIRETELSFNAGGRLDHIDVSLGEKVTAGQTIARLDRRSISAYGRLATAGVQASQAQLELAQDRLARTERLHAAGAASDADLHAAQQQLSLAQAQHAQASAQGRITSTDSSNHILRAPFDGTITRVPSGTGSVVGPGQPLFRLEDLSSLILRSGVTERALAHIQIGDKVEIENPPVVGVVIALARSLDPMTRRAPIEIAVDNPDGKLVGHALVRGDVRTGRSVPALRVPATAIRGDRSVLIVNAQNEIEARPVEAIFEEDGTAVVLGGLSPSERVVVRPSADLLEGTVVSVDSQSPGVAERK
ncbi:MAG: efflux RND transporter periplasmic adaptor subunit [Sandaracinaceae bacterium]|nr:efflux RND transporter periplasmic adaptor subunit [Sandaracinaceae bacterium]